MDTLGSLLRQRREALGLTLAAVAQQVGLTRSYLSMIENGRVTNPPASRHLAALERALRITEGELQRAADWARTPKPVRDEVTRLADRQRRGQAFAAWLRDATRKDKPTGKPKSLDQLHRSGQLTRRLNEMFGHDDEHDTDALDARVPVRFQVPLVNMVAAGQPSGFTDLDYPARVADEYVACPEMTDPQAFAARISGASMEPMYREGDVVVFSPDAKVEDGCDCFVRLEPDHETTFKRIFFEPPQDENDSSTQRVRLQPLNPAFSSLTVSRDRIAGMYRAVWRFQKLM